MSARLSWVANAIRFPLTAALGPRRLAPTVSRDAGSKHMASDDAGRWVARTLIVLLLGYPIPAAGQPLSPEPREWRVEGELPGDKDISGIACLPPGEGSKSWAGLEALITHVIVHEIGHHFGFSDADMHRIEEQAG